MTTNPGLAGNETSTAHIDRRILPLSQDAISHIHSSRHITSLHGVISCLLENSLDAGATKVDISVDWKRGACLLSDNGAGIPAAEFSEGGGLGRMYYTSKRSNTSHDPDDAMHGRNGTFIAQLSAMSLLHIQSVHTDATTPANLTVFHGKIISRQCASDEPANLNHLRQRSGTTIDVKDLFGNMPVRVKQRALLSEPGAESDKAWLDLKRGVVSLLLSWPHKITVKLKDVNCGARAVSLANRTATELTEKRLGQLAGKRPAFDLRDALPLLFQSGLAPYDTRSRWIPLSASTSIVSLKGLICSDPAPSKQCQFIAIGLTPCTAQYGQHEVYEVVNKVIANSSFGVTESGAGLGDGKNSAGNKVQKGVDRYAMYALQLKLRNQPQGRVDVERMSEAFVKSLTDVLEAAVTAWLESNMFRPRKRRKRDLNSGRLTTPRAVHSLSMSPTTPVNAAKLEGEADKEIQLSRAESRARSNQSSHGARRRARIIDLSRDSQNVSAESPDGVERLPDVTDISRMRSGRPFSRGSRPAGSSTDGIAHVGSATASTVATSSSSALTRTMRAAGIVAGYYSNSIMSSASHGQRLAESHPSSEVFGKIDDAELLLAEANHGLSFVDDTTSWKDVTGQEYRVNSRTGVVIPSKGQRHVGGETSQRGATPRHQATIDSTLSSAGLPISLARRSMLRNQNPTSVASDNGTWLPGFLKQWDNPVFAKQREEAIPTASLAGPGLLELEEQRKCCSDKYTQAFAYHSGSSDIGSKLSKSLLTQAKVISQLDNKFILVKMPVPQDDLSTGPSLVLIDQHAASERIILESLLTELCNSTSSSPQALDSSSLIDSTTRGKNLTFEISSKEYDLFTRNHHHFIYWGIKYTTPPPTLTSTHNSHCATNKPTHRLMLTHLPTAVAERCANSPALAIEMLRAEIWAIESGDKKAITSTCNPPTVSETEERWLSLLPLLPIHLLNMLYSRACRSAVMFNDVLSYQECQELVERLGKCVFPFVCAHGRVGMVPVMQFGREGKFISKGSGGHGHERGGERLDGEWLDDRGVGVDVGELRRFMGDRKSIR